jgi:large repetitive protein
VKLRKGRSVARSVFLVACAAAAILAVAVMASAGTSSSATSIAPGTIKADSAAVGVFGVALTTNASDQLTGGKVTLTSVSGFTTGDLSSVQLWRDASTAGANQDVLDGGDAAVATYSFNGGDCSIPPTCTVSFTMSPSAIPTAAEGAYTFLISVRTSSLITNGDTFTAAVTSDSFTTTPAPTVTVPATTSNIVADTVAPVAPTVSALGLSKAAGKVRVGGTAVSGENPAVLEVWHDGDATCASPDLVTENAPANLTQTNTDLVGLTASQTSAIQGVGENETVCYRVRDAAGNPSSYVADGKVPSTPTVADTALLGVRNVTNDKKVSSAVDASPGRTFRLYLRPGGSGLERAKDQNLVTPTFVEITTGSGYAESSSTDIRQFGNSTTLAAADGVAYSRVNANGNDGAVADDGTIPAVPAADELSMLSTSAADGHQRALSEPDATPGRIYGLYLDPNGLTSWQRALTTSGGTTPVRVTTASTSASSPTTNIFAGAGQLTSGFAAGFVRVDGNGNESSVGGNGAIPAAPVADNITYSDALNQFTVNPFPLNVEVGAYAGSDAASAYDGTPEGIATSSAPASVGELAGGLNLFYSAVNTSNGNESPLSADGSVPGVPSASDLTLLSSSAADGHKRLIAAADASPGRTFRLYIDTAGGTSFVRASTLSGGSLPVEVTTDSNGSSSTGGTAFAGSTALAGGHAVGYTIIVGGNDSDVAADGTIPSAVSPSTTSLSDALNNFVASGATAALPVHLYVGSAGDSATVAYSENLNGSANPDGTTSSVAPTAPVSIAEQNPNSTVYYTVSNAANGNESTTVGDGDIPGSPGSDLAMLGVSAAQGHQRVTATSDSTGSRTFRLYVDPSGGTSWTRASTTSGGSTPVEVNTVNGSGSSSPTTDVFAGTTQLTAGHGVGHARVSVDGNDSDVAGDQTIPSAPTAANSFATAAIDEVTSTDATATNNIAVYKSTSSTPAVAYDDTPNVTLDADQTKTLDTSAGDFIFTTKISASNQNESPITDDGVIPAAPSDTASSASAFMDRFVVPDATATNNVRIFLDANSTPATAYANGSDYTADHSPFDGLNLPAQFVFYVAKNTVSGNESAITSDGNIPPAPTGVDGVMSASAADQTIASSNDSSSRTVRLYVDPAGGTAYVAAVTTSGGSTPVELTTSTTSQVVSPQGIYVNTSALGAGASIAYARVLADNESDLVTDGTIPVAPSAGNFGADATDQIATVGSAAASGTYRVFRGTTSASDRVDHTTGTPTAISTTGLAGGDTVGYALTVAGNESPRVTDGTIPFAPGIGLQAASDTGRSPTDHITKDNTPTFDVTTVPSAGVTLFEGSTTHQSTTADGSGAAAPTATALSNDLHTLNAKATVAGNTSPASGPVAVTVDTVAPSTPAAPDLLTDTGVDTLDNITRDTTPSFAGTVEADADATLFAGASQVGATIADGTGAATLDSSTLTDATYAFTIKAQDVAGNLSAASPALSVQIDSTAPAVPPAAALQAASDTGRSLTDGITSDTTPSLDVTGADAGASLALFEDATQLGVATADGSGNATLTSSALSNGSHNLTVSVVDVAGNVSEPSSVTPVVVDTVAPDAPGVLQLSTDTGRSSTDGITSNATPAFALQTESLAIVEIIEGVTSVGEATADNAGVATPAVGSALADGAHSLKAQATDIAGNTSGLSPATGITVDTVVPATPGTPDLVAASDTGSSLTDNITSNATPSFALAVEPDATAQLFAGVSQVASDIADGSGAATVTSVALSDGSYGFAVKAVDVAGNASTLSPELGVQIDTIAPAAPPAAVLQAASDTGRSTTDGITSATTPSLDVAGADANIALQLREGPTVLASAAADGGGNATFISAVLAHGSHALTVSGIDTAGNVSAPSSVSTVVVDTVAPDAPSAPALSNDTGRSLVDGITANATPAFTVTTEALANVDIIKSGSSIGSAIADGGGVASPVAGSALAEGVHSVTAKATDVAGNVSVESSATSITVDTLAPAAPVSIDLQTASDTGSSTTDDITKVNTPTFTVVFAETSALIKLYDGVAPQTGTAVGDASVPITAEGLADGVHSMKATVSDLAGNESVPTSALAITVDTGLPATPATPDLDSSSDTGSSGTDNITGDTTPTLNLAGGEAGTTVTLLDGATDRGTGVVAGNGSASVTASSALGDGVHSFTWKLVDVAGNVSAPSSALSVVIDTGPPTVTQLVTTSALTGQFKAVFSENVSPVNNTNVVLRVTGTTVNVPASVSYDSAAKTATLKTNSALIAGQFYTLIVGPSGATKPSDPAGGQIAPATSPSVRASLLEQESSAGAKQLWAVVSNAGASGASYTTERLNGATASFNFTGSSVTWYTLLGPDQGKARVTIDGVSKGDFDNYRNPTWFKFPRTFTGLSAGNHTIKVIALGTKNAAASNTSVAVDAFKVGSTTYEHASVSYLWQSVVATPASAGRYVRSDVAGTTLNFTFRGTGIDWMTITGPNMGKASVTIDGVSVGTVDNYSSSFRYGVLRSYRGLSDGVHTIRIVVLGQRSSAATGSFVAADKFTVI